MRGTAAHGIALVVCVIWPRPATAQAWIPPAGEGSVNLVHQFARSDEHINRDGVGTRALGTSSLHSVFAEVSYGVGRRIAVDGSLVWLATKWTGDAARFPPSRPHGPLDDGTYHSTFQDARVAVRYQLALRPVAISPFVAFGGPTRAYETRGHSAFGRARKELQAGVSAGRDFRAKGGVGYLHAGASYTVSRRIEAVPLDLDHINGDFEAVVPASSRVNVRGFGSWQVMRDGLKLGPQTDHNELRDIHDRLARVSYVQGGLGATIALRPDVDLGISGFVTAAARNAHGLRALVTGLTWKFGGQFKIDPPGRVP